MKDKKDNRPYDVEVFYPRAWGGKYAWAWFEARLAVGRRHAISYPASRYEGTALVIKAVVR